MARKAVLEPRGRCAGEHSPAASDSAAVRRLTEGARAPFTATPPRERSKALAGLMGMTEDGALDTVRDRLRRRAA